jgi:hypothetical protein
LAAETAYNRWKLPKEQIMDERTRDPVQIRAEDINPRYNWGRALPSLGVMGVDFEERVDYRRLHRYRLGRAKQALENSSSGRCSSSTSTISATSPRPRSASGSATNCAAGRC